METYLITESSDSLITEGNDYLILDKVAIARAIFTALSITTRFTVKPVEGTYTVLPVKTERKLTD